MYSAHSQHDNVQKCPYKTSSSVSTDMLKTKKAFLNLDINLFAVIILETCRVHLQFDATKKRDHQTYFLVLTVRQANVMRVDRECCLFWHTHKPVGRKISDENGHNVKFLSINKTTFIQLQTITLAKCTTS